MSFVGAIKSFNATKGFGFIECAQTFQMYSKDIFVLKSELPGQIAHQGDMFRFNVAEEHNGPVAREVQPMGRSAASQQPSRPSAAAPIVGRQQPFSAHAAPAGVADFFVGRVKSYNVEKGWGMIECPQTHSEFGKDVFFSSSVLPSGHVHPGEEVSFSIKMEEKGPAAASLFLGADDSSYFGTIKSFSREKGWGMIECPQTHQQFGKDVFFAESVAPGGFLAKGQQVTFTIKMEEKGPAASSLVVAGSRNHGNLQQPRMTSSRPAMASALPVRRMQPMRHVQPMMQMQPMMAGGMMYGGCGIGGCGAGMGVGGCGGMGPMMHAHPAVKPDQAFFGAVKRWNDEKGWGHIDCEAVLKLYGRDAFLMRGVLRDQSVVAGDLVSFTVQASAKGPKAESCRVLPVGAFRFAENAGQMYQGTVKSWNEDKGFGFLAGDDIREIFGKDIFLHRRELQAKEVNVGDRVEFQVAVDDKGQPVAKTGSAEAGYAAVKDQVNVQGRSAPY